MGTQTCIAGSWSACEGDVGPVEEVCDGVDNDCDGKTDEGCSCIGCEIQPCGSNTGACEQGIKICENGTWSSCVGATVPVSEVCDGVDNDCDGMIDEVLFSPCALQAGVCANSVQVCGGVDGFLACGADSYGPNYEVVETMCDGLDNDCDGETDNGLTAPLCALQNGVCADSEQECGGVNGFLTCDATAYGVNYVEDEDTIADETLCDGLDNDCDGVVDEGCGCSGSETKACGSSIGACVEGVQTCENGQWGDCLWSIGPTNEICNYKDDDCDGQIDEDLFRACYDGPHGTVGIGICMAGVNICNDGCWGTCQNQVLPQSEICNGLDDDCDGQTDEGTPGEGTACMTGHQGVCSHGTNTCMGGAMVCEQSTFPSSEVCGDGLDNDCDGMIDEGC